MVVKSWKKLSEAESIALKNSIERKDLVIQRVDKGNTCNFSLVKVNG